VFGDCDEERPVVILIRLTRIGFPSHRCYQIVEMGLKRGGILNAVFILFPLRIVLVQ